MSARCWRRLISAALGLAALAGPGMVVRPCMAQAIAEMSPASKLAAVERALQITQQTGRPTVVVATSSSAPHSHQVYEHLLKLPKTRDLSQSMQFTELPAESSPEVVQRHRITRFPTVLVFRKGTGGLELAGREDGARDAYDAVGYLCTLDLGVHRSEPLDPGVKRTNYPYGSAQQPTPQGPAMAVPQQQQQYAPAPQPVYAAPAPQPVYAAPTPQPVYAPQAPQPVYVTPPSAPVVVQPPTQTIVMAPQPAPNIVFAAPAAQPTVSMAPAAAPQPAQLFMAPTAAAPAPAPAPAPVQMVAAPAAAPMMMAAAPVAAAPMMMAAAPVAAAPAAPAQAPIAATVMTLVAPNLIERLVGTIGEHFAQKKNPRLQTAQAPIAQAPIAYAPAAQPAYAPAGAPLGYVPAGYAPAGYAPAGYEAAGHAPAMRRGPYPQAQEPEYTTPSPQNAQDDRSGLFHRLHH